MATRFLTLFFRFVSIPAAVSHRHPHTIIFSIHCSCLARSLSSFSCSCCMDFCSFSNGAPAPSRPRSPGGWCPWTRVWLPSLPDPSRTLPAAQASWLRCKVPFEHHFGFQSACCTVPGSPKLLVSSGKNSLPSDVRTGA